MDNKYDAIIVLGGGRTNDGELTTLSKQRLDAGCKLYHEGAAPKIFALGGAFSTYSPDAIQFTQTGAEQKSAYMIERGVDSEDIIKVVGGRDTIGEAFVSRDTAKELNFKKLLLVTSDKHMERAMFIFNRIFGSAYVIESEEVPCGEILNAEEEKEYLQVTKELFDTLPEEIPTPESWDVWKETNHQLYDEIKRIHANYVGSGPETNEAYMGVKAK
ncbi:MAG: YdcF family protein [Candidatus Moranbacteria bacterium]|nr:YdcF family protein [Candidatus Moranbacteria bacterium]